MDLQETSEVAQEIHPPEHTPMTVEEFLARDIKGYEYVKGELVPMASPSLGHAKVSARITHYLFTYVSENQLGDVFVEAGFKVGDRGMKPDTDADTLTGEDVMQRFSCRVAQFFE